MKRLSILLLLALLLTACGPGPSPVPTTAPPVPAAPAADLVGVWVNAGQYTEGRDFVETLTLNQDGSALIHLDYQGADYATLEGRWTALDGVLSVTFRDPETRDRTYQYTLTETTLTLTGDGKAVEYIKFIE